MAAWIVVQCGLAAVHVLPPVGDTYQTMFVNWKERGVIPAAWAVMIYEPRVPLVVNVELVAMPAESVSAVVVFVPLANVPLAPLAGAVKVTVKPLTASPLLSRA